MHTVSHISDSLLGHGARNDAGSEQHCGSERAKSAGGIEGRMAHLVALTCWLCRCIDVAVELPFFLSVCLSTSTSLPVSFYSADTLDFRVLQS